MTFADVTLPRRAMIGCDLDNTLWNSFPTTRVNEFFAINGLLTDQQLLDAEYNVPMMEAVAEMIKNNNLWFVTKNFNREHYDVKYKRLKRDFKLDDPRITNILISGGPKYAFGGHMLIDDDHSEVVGDEFWHQNITWFPILYYQPYYDIGPNGIPAIDHKISRIREFISKKFPALIGQPFIITPDMSALDIMRLLKNISDRLGL